MKIIAIANQKGGVGKTTTAINLAHCLSLSGNSCLLIDIDPQANATSGLGLMPEHTIGIYPVLTGEKNIAESIVNTGYAGLDVLVSTPLLSALEQSAGLSKISTGRLHNALSILDKKYSYVLIDCPPSFGIFSLNALIASKEIIIPIQSEYFAMEGLSQMIAIIDDVKDKHNAQLKISGILLTMFDHQLQFNREVGNEVRSHFPDLTYKTIIPRDIALAEASSFGQPIMVYSPVSRGTFGYMQLCREVLGNKTYKTQRIINAKEVR